MILILCLDPFCYRMSSIMSHLSRNQVLDLYFMDARHKLIDLAAFLDRMDRAGGEADFRAEAFAQAMQHLLGEAPDRAARVLMSLSDPTTQPIAMATTKAACGAWPGESESEKIPS